MNNMRLARFAVVIFALSFFGLSSYAAADRSDGSPRLIASGPGFTIYQFEGFVKKEMVESVIRSGIVISHTNLESGEMKWLVSTGVHTIPTRRISYNIERIVGLVQDEEHLIVVVYRSGRIFTQTNRPPLSPDPYKGQYVLRVFLKKEGKNIYTWTFKDFNSFPERVPQETTEAGVIKKAEEGYGVFNSVFRIDDSGEVIRKEKKS